MLDRLEVYNFKSYRGRQTIGPLHSFTCVIGPNGAGKSNLMDAISFVLGVRSSSLRSSALKDLIYRSGKRRGGGKKDKKGKGKAVEATDDEEEEDDDEDEEEENEDEEEDGEGAEQVEDDGEERDGERKAWVMAVYIDKDEREWKFQRSISVSGVSDYKLNGKSVTYKKYNEQLESFNILVKAKNFLVFQGDVEQVASQSPKDLAKLIDQISGSLDLKEEYDAAAVALEKATETSVNQHSRRKGVNAEVKQYKEMKKEAERWKSLGLQRDEAIIHHLVWKLFHIDAAITSTTESIETKAAELDEIRTENAKFDEDNKAAKKEVQKATKDLNKQEKELKKLEKEAEEARPAIVAVETQIGHSTTKLKKAETSAATVKKDLVESESKLDSLKKDLKGVEKAQERHKEEQVKAAKSMGFELDEKDLEEYHKLKDTAKLKAVGERQSLQSLSRDHQTSKDAHTTAEDSAEVANKKLEKLLKDESDLTERKTTFDAKVKTIQTDYNKAKKEHATFVERRTQTAQSEAELNEKLRECLDSLQQAGAEKQESERDARFKETLANLKKQFPGVKGRVIDLCKPTQNKYSLAVTTVLGRNIDSVVVSDEKTAIACIEYLRVQRAGQATFIPLEGIQVKPVSDKYRSYARGARLAIDVISFDPSVEKAMQFACGNALVCDTMEIAKHVVYEKGQEVKAVTLEGTIIHRSGLITGGNTGGRNERHFEDREVDGLRRREADLKAKLAEIHKNKPRGNVEDLLVNDIKRLEVELTAAKDDQSATTLRLKGIQDELKVIKKNVADFAAKIKKLSAELDDIEKRMEGHRKVINAEEDKIFSSFCKRIKVPSIREYEEKQLKDLQHDNAESLRFTTQLARLGNQINFVEGQVNITRERVKGLEEVAAAARASLTELETQKAAAVGSVEEIEEHIESAKALVEKLQKALDEKNAAAEEVRKTGAKTARVLDKALKEIGAWNDEIEKLSAERFSIYRRCKLEEIELPLDEGSLNDVPIEDVVDHVDMDVDTGDDETQQARKAKDYGVVVDFESLDEEEEENGQQEMEDVLTEAIAKLNVEMEKMSPNLKAIERLGDSEARFKDIDSEFEDARETTKAAKDAFTAIKKQRCDLFNAAYNHISEEIDGIYKDLTKGTAAPMGGVAYLSLEDSEEPYLHGIKYHAMPPMKRFRDMDQLSGGEKTMAALALLFAIHSYHPSPFFVLDEVDAALDNTNVSRIARYVHRLASPDFQFVVISLKAAFFEQASALVGIYRDGGSRPLTLDLDKYA